ncbi:hypothetical protein RRG08_058589, partial [Elysia crispata]
TSGRVSSPLSRCEALRASDNLLSFCSVFWPVSSPLEPLEALRGSAITYFLLTVSLAGQLPLSRCEALRGRRQPTSCSVSLAAGLWSCCEALRGRRQPTLLCIPGRLPGLSFEPPEALESKCDKSCFLLSNFRLYLWLVSSPLSRCEALRGRRQPTSCSVPLAGQLALEPLGKYREEGCQSYFLPSTSGCSPLSRCEALRGRRQPTSCSVPLAGQLALEPL